MLHFRKAAFISALITGAFLASPAAAFCFANSDHALRAGPGGQTAIAGRVSEGRRIGIIECRDKWCLVTAGGVWRLTEVRFIGVAADPKSAPRGLPIPTLPPTWRHEPLEPPQPILGPPDGHFAEPPPLHLPSLPNQKKRIQAKSPERNELSACIPTHHFAVPPARSGEGVQLCHASCESEPQRFAGPHLQDAIPPPGTGRRAREAVGGWGCRPSEQERGLAKALAHPSIQRPDQGAPEIGRPRRGMSRAGVRDRPRPFYQFSQKPKPRGRKKPRRWLRRSSRSDHPWACVVRSRRPPRFCPKGEDGL